MADNMAVMVRGLRQFIIEEQNRISRENQARGPTEKVPVPESFLDLMITDYITLDAIRVGDFLAIEQDAHGDRSERIVFIVLRDGKYSIEGTTLKTMMRTPDSSIYYNCTGRESAIGRGSYDPDSKALKIDLGQTIYVLYKQIKQLIKAVRRKDQRIFFAVPAGVEYERTVSEGIVTGQLDFVSGYHCQTGSSIELYSLRLCSDDVCSITRRLTQPMLAEPRLTQPAQKRKRSSENIMEELDSKLEIIRLLQEERDNLLKDLANVEDFDENNEIYKRFQENDQQLEFLEKEVQDDERRVKRKLDKERVLVESMRRFQRHTAFVDEFRAKMVQDTINLTAFLADGPHESVDVKMLRKLLASMEEFLNE